MVTFERLGNCVCVGRKYHPIPPDQPEALHVEDVEETLQDLEVEGRRQQAAPFLPPGTCLNMQMSGIFRKPDQNRRLICGQEHAVAQPGAQVRILDTFGHHFRVGKNRLVYKNSISQPQFYYYVNQFYTIR
jgi:hypothetical protein